MGCVKSKTSQSDSEPFSPLKARIRPNNKLTDVTISKFTFSQTDRTVKITIAIPGIRNHPRRKISFSAAEFALFFCVKNLKGRNWFLTIADLAHEIDASNVSFLVVKKDTVNLLLPKKHFAVWSSLRTQTNITTSEAALNEANVLNGDGAERLKERGNKFHSNGVYGEAIKSYSEAIILNPNCAIYYANRAASLIMLKMYREALQDSAKAIEIDKTYAKGYLRKGKIENILGMGFAALSTLKSGLEVDPNNADLRAEMNKALILINSVTLGEKAFREAKFEEADNYYAVALKVASGSAELLFTKLEVMLHCEEYLQVLVLLRGLPQDADWHYMMALLNYMKCNKNDAFFHINKTLGKDPKHPKGNNLKSKMQTIFELWDESKLACQEEDFDKAQMKLEKLLMLDPNNKAFNAEAIGSIGLCFMKLGNYLKASMLFSQSIELRGTHVMYLNRAKCFEHLGRTQESVNDYELLYALNPTDENKKLLNSAKVNLVKDRGQDYYELFGLQQDASPAAIRDAYQKLATECQPDYFSSGVEKDKEEQRYTEIHEAYYTLSDPMKRERYDRMTQM